MHVGLVFVFALRIPMRHMSMLQSRVIVDVLVHRREMFDRTGLALHSVMRDVQMFVVVRNGRVAMTPELLELRHQVFLSLV